MKSRQRVLHMMVCEMRDNISCDYTYGKFYKWIDINGITFRLDIIIKQLKQYPKIDYIHMDNDTIICFDKIKDISIY